MENQTRVEPEGLERTDELSEEALDRITGAGDFVQSAINIGTALKNGAVKTASNFGKHIANGAREAAGDVANHVVQAAGDAVGGNTPSCGGGGEGDDKD